MFVKPIQLRFLKDFSSPVFGNVWKGREVSADAKIARKMIDVGLAEEIKEKNALAESDDKDPVKETLTVKTETDKGQKDADTDSKSKRGKGTSKGK